jgi:hypothetical protein
MEDDILIDRNKQHRVIQVSHTEHVNKDQML